MAEKQVSLFEDIVAEFSDTRGLVLISRPDRPLTKAQQTFNRRIARIEELRAKLDRETRRLDEALAFYGDQIYPRMNRQAELRKDLVRELALFLDDKRLKQRRDRRNLRELVAELLGEIEEHEGPLIEEDLLGIFKRVYRVDYGQAEEEQMKQAIWEMESMFGQMGITVDLSDLRPDMSEEALAAKAAQVADQFLHQAVDEELRAQRRAERPKTRRQLEREARRRQAEQFRTKTIASIYKQLARALHPDLEPDAKLRERKGALMQELTAAYHNEDLHTLLRLELEWIQHEQGDLRRLTDEKLSIYNQVLKEQADELEREIFYLPTHPRYQPILAMDGPFGFLIRTDGPAQVRDLDEMTADMERCLARLRTGEALKEVRDVVEAYAFRAPF